MSPRPREFEASLVCEDRLSQDPTGGQTGPRSPESTAGFPAALGVLEAGPGWNRGLQSLPERSGRTTPTPAGVWLARQDRASGRPHAGPSEPARGNPTPLPGPQCPRVGTPPRYVISSLELLVAEDYMIVYLNGATPRRRMPGIGWLKKCYHMIDRR